MAVVAEDAKRTLHALVDQLPDHRVALLLRGLQGDRTALYLASIPDDDEPVTDEDRAAVAEAEESMRSGRLIPHDEMVRKYVRGS